MKKIVLCIAALATLLATGLRAQDLSGNWQGTLKTPNRDLRVILNFYKGDKDAWSAKMYSIDQGGQPINATSVTKQGTAIKVAVDMIGGTYEAKISEDGKSMNGTWTQGPTPMPLILVKATPETAWEIPAPPPPPKLMAADADPSFDVATIKPNPSGAPAMQQLTINGRTFTIRNGSLGDMISFAYNVQLKQILNGPAWMDSDRYDVSATLDQQGIPNDKQLRGALRKMLEDRFQLKVSHEKREMPAFVLTVAKAGQKLTPTQAKMPLPGMGFMPATGGLKLRVNNGTMEDLSNFLQSTVLDKPVVNQTDISGRFDISVNFTPDDSQFKGHPPKLPASSESNVEQAPDLFTAMQQQVGLKLSAEKAQVDVVSIDKVEKPSPN